jgi:hypothetical protein
MGLAGYYIRFIKGFSNIGYPITSLQKKGVKFVWIAECEESFQQLKHLLTNAPVLKIVDPNKEFLCVHILAKKDSEESSCKKGM